MRLSTAIIILNSLILCHLNTFAIAEPLLTNEQRQPDEIKFYSTVQISFKKTCDSKRKTVCTGALISKKYVLTAAKCVVGFRSKCLEATVDLPPWSKTRKFFDRRSKFFDIVSNISYAQWYLRHSHTGIPRHFLTDIAVIELGTRDVGIKPADISFEVRDQMPGNRVQAIGWGYTQKMIQPTKPTMAPLTILTNRECEQTRLEDGTMLKVPKGLICAVDAAHGTFIVEGDFGGPVLNKDLKVMGILIGRSNFPKISSTPKDPINLILPIAEYADFLHEATIDNDLSTSYISYKVNVITI
ncbi:hypothetical protein QAD02_005974 [Eretmocerus hayati]|uniref:Uncharacterized protein n=1 Tax=Eretmocerus hayati TaxID=131215 RepID=A0ACC2N027_9HYME|nr:hypothetical protein QAD02_005974 [Eretmocerus hayati]